LEFQILATFAETIKIKQFMKKVILVALLSVAVMGGAFAQGAAKSEKKADKKEMKSDKKSDKAAKPAAKKEDKKADAAKK
jgi:Ni/Co efflux regulator RcnB